jgi:hypothetical protein
MRELIAGALSGLAATVPMTLAMEGLFRRLPWSERYPLPPRKVTMELAETFGLRDDLSEAQRHALTLSAHLGYGAAMGALYALTTRRVLPGAVGGALYGLGVWAGNYLALLPQAELHPHAAQEPRERNLLMIGAHLVWGAALGTLLDGAGHR